MRIVKYQGSAHGTNEYPFLIDRDGFSVMPISSIGLGASEVAQKIIHALSEPFQLKEQCVNIGVTIGISLFPADGDTSETLIQRGRPSDVSCETAWR